MDREFIAVIIFNIVGISIGVWFLWTRLRAKLDEVEERKARRWKPDESTSTEEE